MSEKRDGTTWRDGINRCRIAAKELAWRLRYRGSDARSNAAWCREGQRILVMRHSGKHPNLQAYYLNWLAREFPEIRSLFELRVLPWQVRDWSRYRLYVPWFQDPAVDWMTRGMYTAARRLEDACDARGIPVINRVEATANCIRDVAAERLRAAEVNTPRIVPIRSVRNFLRDLGGLRLPLIVRESRGHGKAVVLVQTRGELEALRWERMRHPIAVEYVDVASPSDRMFRKCRFVVAGTLGVRRHLIVSRGWEVRAESRVSGGDSRAEELAYLMGKPTEHEVLERARRCLDLDWAAFDYSFDSRGQVIVWETNPYPNLSFPTGQGTEYTFPFVERSFAAMTHLYLTAAGWPVPDGVIGKLLGGISDHRPASAAA